MDHDDATAPAPDAAPPPPEAPDPPVAASAPDPVAYLDRAAASAPGQRYKRILLAALDLRAGHHVLDIGCGPGTDLATFAAAVGPAGRVVGVDRDPRMVTVAAGRLGDRANVEVRLGDAHALPVDDDSVDRAYLDRVVQHLENPRRAMAEVRRVLRPGGVVGLAEPDWDTLVIDDVDLATSRAFARFLADVQVRNAAIGRALARLATDEGLVPRTVTGTPILFRDFPTAEAILGLRRNADRAVAAGFVTRDAAQAWLDRLGDGPFLAAFVLFAVTAEAPA
jgi:ubiquinone/menaquinone biosynthesis C-methylase UbiE